MSPADGKAGVGTGDAVVGSTEVASFVPSDPGGVVVQPGTTTNETRIRETQTVFMNTVNPFMVLHLIQ